MSADRASVVQVIKDVSEALAARRGAGASTAQSGDSTKEALARACSQRGVSPQDYAAALRDDPTLADLEKEAIAGAMVGGTDPGPYDTISRESPSGQPGDLTKSREE